MENITKDFTLVGNKGSETIEKISKPSLTAWQDAWRRFRKNKVALVALILLILTLVFAVGSSLVLSQKKANTFDASKTQVYGNLPPKLSGDLPVWNGQFKAPGETTATDLYSSQGSDKNFVFGTDKYGRSLAERTVVGLRISLIIALAAALIDLVIGVIYGLISGWVGGRVDMVMQRIIEIITSIPNLVIVTMLSLVLGQSIASIIIAIGLFAWTGMARQVRGMVLTYKERDFVLAAKTLGQPTWRIAVKHLLPNVSGVIIVQLMFDIPAMILYESVLSAINLGVKPPTASLGTLITDGISTLQYFPFQFILPALVLSLLSLIFIFLGDGLRDAFDPRASED